MIDSGAFGELLEHGRWELSARQYAARVTAWADAGGLEWAASQDWLCSPMVRAKTGLSVREHQRRAVESWLELRELAPAIHWVPTVQGWNPEEYLEHVEMYGPELLEEPLVGVGSLALRQGSDAALLIVHELADLGLELHGWGVKTLGLRRYGPLLASADSHAWSHEARSSGAVCGLEGHVDCRNCLEYAERWALERAGEMSSSSVEPHQMSLLMPPR